MLHCLLVFLGGGIGSLCRYGIQHIGISGASFLYTLTANISGCLAIGIIWALLDAWHADKAWNLLLITGLLGGYTTFSAFSLDVVQLIQVGKALTAAAYVAASVLGGPAACGIGLYATQRIIRIFA